MSVACRLSESTNRHIFEVGPECIWGILGNESVDNLCKGVLASSFGIESMLRLPLIQIPWSANSIVLHALSPDVPLFRCDLGCVVFC